LEDSFSLTGTTQLIVFPRCDPYPEYWLASLDHRIRSVISTEIEIEKSIANAPIRKSIGPLVFIAALPMQGQLSLSLTPRMTRHLLTLVAQELVRHPDLFRFWGTSHVESDISAASSIDERSLRDVVP